VDPNGVEVRGYLTAVFAGKAEENRGRRADVVKKNEILHLNK